MDEVIIIVFSYLLNVNAELFDVNKKLEYLHCRSLTNPIELCKSVVNNDYPAIVPTVYKTISVTLLVGAFLSYLIKTVFGFYHHIQQQRHDYTPLLA